MLQLILMLLGLAFSNGNTTNCNNNNQDPITVQNSGGVGLDPGTGTDPGETGGDTIPLPPKK
ncbi:hypothetical protein [Chryseobacterium schmidteae]|uniref:hypothetical protein n=1 Tax=Chryseobacterium schmidteae TaxID=2730404 RepID=UPI00158CB261|nr:hypothetical protein [Chryseobacterium schmidteae]